MNYYTEQQAQQRVIHSKVLAPYYAIICEYDWHEGQEHIDWICTAPISEILNWAQRIQADFDDDGTQP